MSRNVDYIVVSPVRDEVAHVAETVESMVRQTIRPVRWVIVDDGSTDGTGPLLDELAAPYDWIRVLHRPNRGFRANGGGVMDAFYAGFDTLGDLQWELAAKLDADLSFAPDYFEHCIAHFDAEPKLGIGGGLVCSRAQDGTLSVDSVGDPPFHVRGATKIYRHACWQQIAPLIKAAGWDTLDEVRANYFGWTTHTFTELEVVQHKPTGSADGIWRNAVKNGRANYLTGYHPLFMFGKCARRLVKAPLKKEWLGLLTGYVGCYLKRQPPLADPPTIQYLRRQQMQRLRSRPSIYSSQGDTAH